MNSYVSSYAPTTQYYYLTIWLQGTNDLFPSDKINFKIYVKTNLTLSGYGFDKLDLLAE